MEVRIFDDRKIVEIWLTRSERDAPAVQEYLKPLYSAYRPKKYTVAVFLSGDGDLYQQTSNIICYNRRRIAELEVRREKTEHTLRTSAG